MNSTTNPTLSKFKLPAIKFMTALRGVNPAEMPNQIIAGITLAALMIPLNIGYAQVAGLPPIVGLYASIVPMILWGLFATSRNLVAGPDAPVAALIGSLLVTFAATTDPRYIELAYAQAIVVAFVFFLAWFFQLGFLANFLSKAVLVGFISGLGIEVLTSQISKIMGIHVESERWLLEVFELIRRIPEANWYSVAIGVGAIVLIRVLKRYAPKIPGALVALILATALVAVFGLDQKGVSVLGEIPAGLPTLHLPQVGIVDYIRLFPGALALAGVTMAEGLLIARKYAQKYNDQIDSNQELFAFGAANIASGLTGGFMVGSSASRTAAMDSSGMRSQIPAIVGAIVVALVLLFLTGLLALVPNAVLGGIVANAVVSLIEIDEQRELWKYRRAEFWIAMVCLASVLAFGALEAVIIAFLLSTILVVGRASNPQTTVLKLLPSGKGYASSSDLSSPMTVPGLILFRFGAELFFANANAFQDSVKKLVGGNQEKIEWFVLDAEQISDIDTTGREVLEQTIEYLREKQITFAMSRVHHPLPELLERYELLDKIGKEKLYATNRDAVGAFRQANPPPASVDSENETELDG
ncbi:MAG: SulP family inorganic anion transporter [Chloroflexota bacterium]|nr:MAG: SulP family inorganic anion transporter [Chloroflexota bacterium]